MLRHFSQRLGASTSSVQQCRLLRTRWERGYLKDLYHRRQLIGADPLIARSAYPNWDYKSELFAFGHRIGAPEISENEMIQAFTDKSYLENEAVETDEAVTENNVKLQLKGGEKMSNWLKRYLRFHLTKAPEELIEAIDAHLLSDECLSMIATHLGVDHLVRTREHPPTNEACANALRALAGVLSDEKAKNLVIDFIVPQLVDVDFADIYPLADPMGVLKDLLKADGVAEVEPRILRSAGEVSAEPIFVVGIYADKKKLVGQSAGESLQVAMDMAAREALLRLWDITSDRVLFFGDRAAKSPLEQYSKENYRLSEKCSKQTDLSLETFEMLKQEPMNLIETVLRYRNEVDRVVGKSYTKRLRHKFSRGSLAKRSFKYLVKPKPYTVA